jgi:hypothetical protein
MNKKTLLLILAFALSIVLGTYLWFSPSKEIPISHSIQDVKIVANHLNQLEATHQTKLEKLQANNDFLLTKIKQSKIQVLTSKNKVAYLRKELQQLNQQQILNTQVDTSQFVIRCDSLQTMLDNFINVSSFSDSIVNEQILQYEDLITTKDSMINCIENDYHALKINCDTLLKIQSNLLNENKQIYKKLTRTKRMNRFLKGSAFVVAGLITATQLFTSP